MRFPLPSILALLALVPSGEASFLVVFIDGGFLQVEGVELLSDQRLRLQLPEGASIEVPLQRVEKVVDATLAQASESQQGPSHNQECSYRFSPEALPEKTPFARELLLVGEKHDLHPRLLAAIVAVESGFNPWAVSRVGARGLMQLMPSVWASFGLLEPHDPRGNLEAGAGHLRKLLALFGRLDLALAAYNAGPAVVQAYGGIPPYRETQDFVDRVFARFCPPGRAGDL
ncbi:MAG: lytic transglycosylase domain-containing protein [Thermoanaerobaculaceae bacterium]